MIKKIYLLLFISIILCACGKKGDPVYQKEDQNSGKIITQMSTFS